MNKLRCFKWIAGTAIIGIMLLYSCSRRHWVTPPDTSLANMHIKQNRTMSDEYDINLPRHVLESHAPGSDPFAGEQHTASQNDVQGNVKHNQSVVRKVGYHNTKDITQSSGTIFADDSNQTHLHNNHPSWLTWPRYTFKASDNKQHVIHLLNAFYDVRRRPASIRLDTMDSFRETSVQFVCRFWHSSSSTDQSATRNERAIRLSFLAQ